MKNMRNKSLGELTAVLKAVIVGLLLIGFTLLFLVVPPQGVDWRVTFYPTAGVPLNPYSVPTFVNPPWTALLLFPLQFASVDLSAAINTSLNFVLIGLLVIRRKGDLISLALTMTSFPFLALLANGSTEWIPAIGFILQNGWGLPLVLTKPQSGILAVIAWFSPAKKRILFLLPVALTLLISFLLWGNWLLPMLANVQYMRDAQIGLFTVSISPFPWAIPIGLGLMVYILKCRPRQSEIFGILATLCLVPYFVPHSLTILFALLSVSHRRASILTWLLLWSFAVFSGWGEVIRIFGLG
jgi:hypothetical protein